MTWRSTACVSCKADTVDSASLATETRLSKTEPVVTSRQGLSAQELFHDIGWLTIGERQVLAASLK